MGRLTASFILHTPFLPLPIRTVDKHYANVVIFRLSRHLFGTILDLLFAKGQRFEN